jgi:hypothetical protein
MPGAMAWRGMDGDVSGTANAAPLLSSLSSDYGRLVGFVFAGVLVLVGEEGG